MVDSDGIPKERILNVNGDVDVNVNVNVNANVGMSRDLEAGKGVEECCNRECRK